MSEETLLSLMAAVLFTKALEDVDYPDKPWTDDNRLSSDDRAARIAVNRARLIRVTIRAWESGRIPFTVAGAK